ncbi:MAG: DedA family protein [Patescibacteria group bacterium]
MVEGLNTMVLGGFLVSVNTIKLLPIFLLFILAYTINGYIWYTVGYFAGAKPIDKWGRKDRKGRKIIEKVEEYFNKYSGRAIIVTKFTFSLTIATLIMAGSLKYNLKKFSFYNFIGSVGWVVVTLFVGYFFGQSYKLFFVYLKNFTYGLVFLGGAIALIYIIKLILGSAFVKSLFITDKIKELSDKLRNGLEEFLSNGNGSKEE